ncbi:MAG: class I SAM-dependent methyltransferase [bacterium]
METVSCNICSSCSQTRLTRCRDQVFGHSEEFQLVRCNDCELVYLSPRPEKNEMGKYYPPGYQQEIRKLIDRLRGDPILRRGLEMLARRRLPPRKPPGRVLEVGCSFGDYLGYLRRNGWDVEGIELDPDASRYAREADLAVHEGDAERILPTLPSGRFDVVALWHLIEHLYDPLAALQEIGRVLKPGGLLLMELPNFASLLAGRLGQAWFPLEVPRHLYHFTPVTISRLLSRAGFAGVSVRSLPAPEAIVWSLRLLRKRAGSTSMQAQDFLRLNPLLAALFFPLSWVLSRMGRGDHMAVRATRP